jgi:hypothetical protein
MIYYSVKPPSSARLINGSASAISEVSVYSSIIAASSRRSMTFRLEVSSLEGVGFRSKSMIPDE